MGILKRFSVSSMSGRPFADYLNVSTPSENADSFRGAVLPVLDALGNFQEVAPGLFQFYRIAVVKGSIKPLPDGTVKFGRRGRVSTFSLSGAVLHKLRAAGLYSELLAAIGSQPHRVTMLHVTADYLVDSPPAFMQLVKGAMYAGEVAFTRKWVQPSQCQHVFSQDCDGLETGTCYMGQRENADVWGKVYDKRHERISRGFPDPGPLVRVEIACMSDVGATLRDAFDPRDLFFHYAGRTLCEVPPDCSGWVPHGEGYVLGQRRERSLWERFDAVLSGSRDVRRLAEMALLLHPDRGIAAQFLGRHAIALVPDVLAVPSSSV
jgi:hypothetical protein